MQAAPNQYFASNTHAMNILPAPPAKSVIFTHNPYALNILAATHENEYFSQPRTRKPIDSKSLAPKSFIM